MIELSEFTRGLGVIALQLNQALQEDKIRAYFLALQSETTAEEWEGFVHGIPGHLAPAVKRHGWRFMPAVPELLDALERYRGRPPLDVEATQAYERVLAARTYTPEGGATWVYRDVIDLCGVAAGVAFLAAGGNEAFRTTYQEEQRRARFAAAYVAEARSAPAGRLGPARDALAAGQAGSITAEAARQIIGEIERRAADLPAEEPGP